MTVIIILMLKMKVSFVWNLVILVGNLPFLFGKKKKSMKITYLLSEDLLSPNILLQTEHLTMEIVFVRVKMEMKVDSGELMAVPTILSPLFFGKAP